MASEKRYLGDAVYVDVENVMLKLTVEYGDREPAATIYLEPAVYDALTSFVDEMRPVATSAGEDT